MKYSLFLFLLVTACGYKSTKLITNKENAPYENKINESKTIHFVDFHTIKTHIFEKYCLECHSNDTGNKGRVNLETYTNTIEHLADIKADIEDDTMPKNRPPLSSETKKIILDWIQAGAPETETSP